VIVDKHYNYMQLLASAFQWRMKIGLILRHVFVMGRGKVESTSRYKTKKKKN